MVNYRLDDNFYREYFADVEEELRHIAEGKPKTSLDAYDGEVISASIRKRGEYLEYVGISIGGALEELGNDWKKIELKKPFKVTVITHPVFHTRLRRDLVSLLGSEEFEGKIGESFEVGTKRGTVIKDAEYFLISCPS